MTTASSPTNEPREPDDLNALRDAVDVARETYRAASTKEQRARAAWVQAGAEAKTAYDRVEVAVQRLHDATKKVTADV